MCCATLTQVWNFVSGSSGVCLFPYLNLYLAQCGLSSAQIGLLAALRTWLAAPISLAATAAAADRYRLHKQLLLLAIIASCGLRSSLPLLQGPALLFAALLAANLLGAPVGVLADSTVLSNCNEVRIHTGLPQAVQQRDVLTHICLELPFSLAHCSCVQCCSSHLYLQLSSLACCCGFGNVGTVV